MRRDQNSWLRVLRRYFVFIAVANLVWEFAQMPLYTLWYEGKLREIVFAGVHCTGGDLLISIASIVAALILFGTDQWPQRRYTAVTVATVLLGLSYTIFSEWLNTEIRGSWAYAEQMPLVPIIGTGISPLLQWIVIPLAAFWWARHQGVEVVTREIVV